MLDSISSIGVIDKVLCDGSMVCLQYNMNKVDRCTGVGHRSKSGAIEKVIYKKVKDLVGASSKQLNKETKIQ